jgi:hypothetical protein
MIPMIVWCCWMLLGIVDICWPMLRTHKRHVAQHTVLSIFPQHIIGFYNILHSTCITRAIIKSWITIVPFSYWFRFVLILEDGHTIIIHHRFIGNDGMSITHDNPPLWCQAIKRISGHFRVWFSQQNQTWMICAQSQVSDLSLHITNCFAVPFEEDPRDPQARWTRHIEVALI